MSAEPMGLVLSRKINEIAEEILRATRDSENLQKSNPDNFLIAAALSRCILVCLLDCVDDDDISRVVSELHDQMQKDLAFWARQAKGQTVQ